MSYIGKTPATGNFIKLDAITTSSTNTYNLLKDSVAFTPESANHMIVSLNGVIQAPLTAFTVSGSTITFIPSSGTLSSSDSIDFILVLGNVLDIGTPSDDTISASKLKTDSVIEAKIQNNAVTTDKINNDAVTTDKINLISTSSTPSLEAKGTSGQTDGYIQLNCEQNSHGIKLKSPPHSAGQSYTLTFPSTAPANNKFLQTNSSGVLSFADAGGGLVKLAETNISSGVSTVSFDGYFTSDYDIYKVFYQNLRPVSSGNTTVCVRFRRSNADVTASSYYGVAQQAYQSGSNHSGDFPSSLINIVKDSSVKGNSDYGISGEFTIYNPLQTTRYKMMSGFGTYLYDTSRWYTHQFGGVLKDNTTALSGFTFLNSVGENFDGGNLYLFGFKTT